MDSMERNKNTFLIIGLGNPHKRFKLNRHNIGYILANYYAETKKFKTGMIRTDEKLIKIRWNIVGNKTIVLIKPRDWMNNSGISSGILEKILQVPHENILLIHDDMDFAFGSFKIKSSGGTGGHNGVASVIQYIGKDINRLRIGIGRPTKEGQTAYQYVLSDFTNKECSYFCDMCLGITQIVDDFIGHGAQYIMNHYQRK